MPHARCSISTANARKWDDESPQHPAIVFPPRAWAASVELKFVRQNLEIFASPFYNDPLMITRDEFRARPLCAKQVPICAGINALIIGCRNSQRAQSLEFRRKSTDQTLWKQQKCASAALWRGVALRLVRTRTTRACWSNSVIRCPRHRGSTVRIETTA